MKIKLLDKMTGVSKAGNPYSRVTLLILNDNSRVVKEFFVSPKVVTECDANLDDYVVVACELNGKGMFDITEISKAEEESDFFN